MSRPSARALTALLTVAALAAVGCGSDDDGAAARPATTVRAGAAAPTTVDIGGRQPFATTSAWNRTIGSLPPAPHSARMIKIASESPLATRDRTSHDRERNNRNLYVNTTGWAPGVYRVGTGSTVKMVCRQGACGRKGDPPPATLTLPADAVPDPGHDGWLVLVDEQAGIVWDLWRARRGGDTIAYAFARKWRLTGDGAGPLAQNGTPRAPSLRGSGLPMLGGLIRPVELRSGTIPHALAIAIPNPRAGRFVRPASTTNGLGSNRSVPEGARLRLRASAVARLQRRDELSPGATAIVQALMTYGAIVVDRADSPTLYAQRNGDYRTVLRGNDLAAIKLSDFDVLSTGSLQLDPDAPPEATR
ncbi:hypothetical protein [Patulibacter sp. SYSU D01012]|uniref:hypothetical protein n=1 Tax=Patulibacter sp. SYSU D01012 TaxID=2817381 RepID=UPI001B313201|nr:hypothetical protein [Patulibacter sp. SYSU D01012]